jgi:hypothetical protein
MVRSCNLGVSRRALLLTEPSSSDWNNEISRRIASLTPKKWFGAGILLAYRHQVEGFWRGSSQYRNAVASGPSLPRMGSGGWATRRYSGSVLTSFWLMVFEL